MNKNLVTLLLFLSSGLMLAQIDSEFEKATGFNTYEGVPTVAPRTTNAVELGWVRDSNAFYFYDRVNAVWVKATANGEKGEDGNTILSGYGVPDNTSGVPGDYYIDTDAYRIYGPKAGGVWGVGSLLIGPEGPQGPAGSGVVIVGTVATADSLPDPYGGAISDMFIAEDTGFGHVYNDSGTFTNVGAIRGPEGPQGNDGATGPQGQQGVAGSDGQDGANGADGNDGSDGQDATVAVGTTTTSAPGGDAAVSNTGTPGAAVFNFTIPRGQNGVNGDGWTSGSYNASTGVVTFSSDDGLTFSTGDLRGADGLPGTDGTNGADGADGIDGNGIASTSYNASTGILTLTFDDSTTYSTGGIRGQDGVDGQDGAPGADGNDGATGATGPQGPVGNTGPQGPQGIQGETGADGADGVDGQDGAQGPQGVAGADGQDGAPGADGTNGADGATGPAGPQGETGPSGADGSDGAQGVPGSDGAQGPQGAQGIQGETGPVGADGADGQDGAQGVQGEQGPAGNDGADGLNGAAGEPGAQGPQGEPGEDAKVEDFPVLPDTLSLYAPNAIVRSGGLLYVNPALDSASFNPENFDVYGRYEAGIGTKIIKENGQPARIHLSIESLPIAPVDETYYVPVYSETDTATFAIQIGDIGKTEFQGREGVIVRGDTLEIGAGAVNYGQTNYRFTTNRVLRGVGTNLSLHELNLVIGGVPSQNVWPSANTQQGGILYLTGRPLVGVTGGTYRSAEIILQTGGQSGGQRSWGINNRMGSAHPSGTYSSIFNGALVFVSSSNSSTDADVETQSGSNIPLALLPTGVTVAPQVHTKTTRIQATGTASSIVYTEYMTPDLLSVSATSPVTLQELMDGYGTTRDMTGNVPGGGVVHYDIFLSSQVSAEGKTCSRYFVTWSSAGFSIEAQFEGSSEFAPTLEVNSGALQVRLRESTTAVSVAGAIKRIGTYNNSLSPTRDN